MQWKVGMTPAEANIQVNRGISPVWIIPLVALVLGVYMVIHTWMNEGPEVTILFATAEGLEPGKTRVSYRNVNMGLVTDVSLTDNLEKVAVRVQFKKQAEELLRADSRFWLVTARVGSGNISGLNTLLSGAYIRLDPGTGKKGRLDEYTALDSPPVTPADAPGLRLNLLSKRAGSISVGDKVLYRGYTVGRVETVAFDAAQDRASYQVFIDAPFHELVDSSVRFWNSSGIAINAGADGISVRTESIENILLGGIAFDRPPGMPAGSPVAPDTEFNLHGSYEASLQDHFRFGEYVVVQFRQSVKGLVPGAPVEYRGVRVGSVERIMLREMIEEQMESRSSGDTGNSVGEAIPVLLYVEPGRLALPDTQESLDILMRNIIEGARQGLRARLDTGNLLTGKLYVGLDYYPDAQPLPEVGRRYGYTVIPSITGNFDQLLVKVNRLLDKLNDAPLESVLVSTNEAITAFEGVLDGLDRLLDDTAQRGLPADIEGTLEQLQETLAGLSPDSDFYQALNGVLMQLNRSLNNIETLTRTLATQPNALVVPTNVPEDIRPEVRQ